MIGITQGEGGWVDMSELLCACNKHDFPSSSNELLRVVDADVKKRFSLSADHSRIRANQGHTVGIQLQYSPAEPPFLLYHGTAKTFLSSIKLRGLIKGRRHYVHLSLDLETATNVGARHGQPVVLVVRSGAMYDDGYKFYRSENNVWLTDHVPVKYLSFGLEEYD